MAAGRSLKSLLNRRRRLDEGEDEEGPVMMEDSQSEGSVLSEGGEDEASSLDEPQMGDAAGVEKVDVAVGNGAKTARKARNRKGKEQVVPEASQEPVHSAQTSFKAMADTEAMMHGLRIQGGAQPDTDAEEVLNFESMERETAAVATAPTLDALVVAPSPARGPPTPAERQRREHEDYRRKRDADPAFTPNRGNFFMHDTRGHQNGQPPAVMRGGWQGRGRGRGGSMIGGHLAPANPMAQAAEQNWKHDLHAANIEEPAQTSNKPADSPQQRDQEDSARLFRKPMPHPVPIQPRVLSFSTTTMVGKVQIRVFLPGMRAPIAFSEVPWKHYIRLPNHRPPLRRDKPVRISLPDRAPHYIFPSPDRSFIFIPRQNRPNQPSFHRGAYQRSVGGYGLSSRRTSMYGGSMYASSVSASRRSSMAGISRAGAFSPNSFVGMPSSNMPPRLPSGATHFSPGPMSGQHTPIGMQIHTYPLPQQPTYQGTPTHTVHQPRPQKTISVTGIESPALLQQASATPQNLQPFQNQLPAHLQEQQAYAQQAALYSPQQQYAYVQPQTGTPLSGIPEQGMHAQNYQAYAQQTPYYASYPTQQGYYYSAPSMHEDCYPSMPMYAPPSAGPPEPSGPQPPYLLPPNQHQQTPVQPPGDSQHSQSGMLAHESNGMVFYLPQSEVEQDPNLQYQPAESFVPSYAMAGLPPPTPAPDAAAAAYYYGPQMQQAMYYPGPAGQ